MPDTEHFRAENATPPFVPLEPCAVRGEVEQLARRNFPVFKLLSDETRLKIILLLTQSGELRATEIFENFTLSQPTVSLHLGTLTEKGYLTVRKEGRHTYYSLTSTAQFPLKIIESFAAVGRDVVQGNPNTLPLQSPPRNDLHLRPQDPELS